MKRISLLLALCLLLASCGAAATQTQTVTPEGTTYEEEIPVLADAVAYSGTIGSAGVYRVTGNVTSPIVIDAGDDDVVHLVLDNATIKTTDAAIYEKNAERVIVTLVGKNTVTDGARAEGDPDAAIYAQDTLVLRGDGSLTVSGNAKQGIASKDRLIVLGGTLNVTAKNHGLRGRDGVLITGGTSTVTAGGDAIQANQDEDAAKGWVIVRGGTLKLTATDDGIQAATGVTVEGGHITVTAGGGASTTTQGEPMGGPGRGMGQGPMNGNTNGKTNANTNSGAGPFPQTRPARGQDSGEAQTTTEDESKSAKGISAGGAVLLTGGTVNLNAATEGVEGKTITMTGGTVTIRATDDGLNATAKTADNMRAQDGVEVRITGGSLTVSAQGDGVDSNGDLILAGGTVAVNGPTSGGNSALDSNGALTVTGGTLVAAGSLGMLELPDENTTQPTLVVTFANAPASGTQITVLDRAGKTVATAIPEKTFGALIFSNASLQKGVTYTIQSAGKTLCTVTLSDTVTAIASDGSAATIGQGGMGGGPRGERPAGGNRGTPPDGTQPNQAK